MAGGWARDGAVEQQIEDTVKDAVLRARALTPSGTSAEDCDDCGSSGGSSPFQKVRVVTTIDYDLG